VDKVVFYIKRGYSRVKGIFYKDKKGEIIDKNHSFFIDNQ
jgi:hypothetical protein